MVQRFYALKYVRQLIIGKWHTSYRNFSIVENEGRTHSAK